MTQPIPLRRYIDRETGTNVLINGVMSVVMFLVAFGFGPAIPVWGVGNYVFDFLPQSFAVAFFSTFISSLLARRAVDTGKITSTLLSGRTTGSFLKRSIVVGLAVMTVGTVLWAIVFWLSGVQIIAATPALAIKVIYGAVLGALVARFRLRAMLG